MLFRSAADVNAYLYQQAYDTFNTPATTIRGYDPNHVLEWGPTGGNGNGSRPQVLQALADNQVVIVEAWNPKYSTISLCSGEQAYAITNLPLVWWVGLTANADSYWNQYPSDEPNYDYATQALRGAGYSTTLSDIFSDQANTQGCGTGASTDFYNVGVNWWALTDAGTGEKTNWGRMSPNDNLYNGVDSRVATSVDAFGFPVGGETGNYGDSTDAIYAANANLKQQVITSNLSVTITITTSSLPVGTVGEAYSANLTAIGGIAPYTWSVTVGSLPGGLSLTSSGGNTDNVISGTPTTSSGSPFTFTVKVQDSSSPTPLTAYATLSITINVLTITTTSLPTGNVGTSYTATLTATGGTTPYTWSISQGSLPPGLSLAGSTGIISGTPTTCTLTQGCVSNFMVSVQDAAAHSVQAPLSITIFPVGPPPAVLTGVTGQSSLTGSSKIYTH